MAANRSQPKGKWAGEARKERRNRRGGGGAEVGGDPYGRPRPVPWAPILENTIPSPPTGDHEGPPRRPSSDLLSQICSKEVIESREKEKKRERKRGRR